MKLLSLVVLLIASEVSNGQYPNIYKYPQIREHKTNLFIDTLTGKAYEIRVIDSFIKAGTGVGLVRPSVAHDTAYWKFYFVQQVSDLYRKYFGKQFPTFLFTTMNDERINSGDGKVVLFNFWSITCAPCISEMPYLNRLVDSLGSASFEYIAATPDTYSEVKKFLIRHSFNYKIVTNASWLTDQIGVRNYPTNMIIDTSGKVVLIREGLNLELHTRRPLIGEEIDSALRAL
jgi:thiol-disulfide isomerase/thioredoxin